jgi:hypothetical protein
MRYDKSVSSRKKVFVMNRYVLSALLLLGVTSPVVHAESCSATKYVDNQCVFDIPAIENGEQFTATYNGNGMIGGVIASCDNDTVSYEVSACQPINKSDCVIPETIWGGSLNFCKHEAMPGVLADGAQKVALSDTGYDGRITYSCTDGELTQDSSFCSDELKSSTDQKVNAQATTNQSVMFVTQTGCDTADITGTMDWYTLDKAEVYLCQESGYQKADEILTHSPIYGSYDAAPYYYVEVSCSSNTNEDSACSAAESDTGYSDDFVQTLDCDTATVAGVVYSATSGAPSNSTIESALCVDNGFSTLDSVSKNEAVDPSGNTYYGRAEAYYVEGVCSGNANPESMCTSDGVWNVSVIDCDSASISGHIDGKQKVSETQTPTFSEVQSEVCVPNGYARLKEISMIEFSTGGLRGTYDIAAICEANTSPSLNCADTCMGNRVGANSSLPKLQGSDGYYYEDLCIDSPTAPVGFCQDCENAELSFSDPLTGNTCLLQNQNLLTGGVEEISFANSDYNGSMTASCNSSEATVLDGECFKTCKGGDRAVWRDSYGDNSCGATIPSGDYYQGETVSLTSDIHNGSSEFQCDDGEWVKVGSSSCELDCAGSFSWGSGISDSGVNKSGICRAEVSFLKSGSSSSSQITSTTPYTDGKATAVCSDGKITVSGAKCDLDCRSESGVWGSGRCAATIPDIDNGNSRTVTTPSALTGYSGRAVFACSDGKNSLGSSTCYEDCSSRTVSLNSCSFTASASKHDGTDLYTRSDSSVEASIALSCDDGTWKIDSGSYCATGKSEYGKWSSWRNDGSGYDYGSWTPSRSNYYTDQDVTQTRSYKQDKIRQRDHYKVFEPSSRRDYVGVDYEHDTLTLSNSRTVKGTKARPVEPVEECQDNGIYMEVHGGGLCRIELQDWYWGSTLIAQTEEKEDCGADERENSYYNRGPATEVNGKMYHNGYVYNLVGGSLEHDGLGNYYYDICRVPE